MVEAVAQKFKTGLTLEELASASSQAIGIKVDGDSDPRIKLDAGGKITWGSGSAAGDVTLYRSAANTIKTDDTFEAAGGIITLTTDGEPSASLPNGAFAVDTTNHLFYFRSDSTWTQVSSGGDGYQINLEGGAPDTTDYATASSPVDGGTP